MGDKGVTTNVDEAHSFIIVKKYEKRFQRLDYKVNAPLVKERNYRDSSLTILEGVIIFIMLTDRWLRPGIIKTIWKTKHGIILMNRINWF